MKFKDYGELNLGSNDAKMFGSRRKKEFFNQIFVKRDYLNKIIDFDKHFLIGEKGTGKTAFAVYLSNNTHANTSSILTFISETDYRHFVALKEQRTLDLSDYVRIWKVIIYLLFAEKLSQDEKEKSIFQYPKFLALRNAIDEYYAKAFAPEIIHAMQFIDKANVAAKLLSKYSDIGTEVSFEDTITESKYQTNLLYIQKKFEEALSSIKLNYDHIVFIDGIDIRPDLIDYDTYLTCIKGLANAVWSLNNDFFGNIKGSKGQMKVMLLIRPDIFHTLNLQNQNAKLRDNSVFLDWRVVYDEYRSSFLFEMADKLLGAQQDLVLALGEAWDHYFPYKRMSTVRHRDFDPSFLTILRFSFYRPRDIVTLLQELQINYNEQGLQNYVFAETDFLRPKLRNNYSAYLLGEIRDHLRFYYSEKDFEYFIKFFQYLRGKVRFDYTEYVSAYDQMQQYLSKNNVDIPLFFLSSDLFLQFLYEMNVISYVEDSRESSEIFISWCFRERTVSNIAPKVRTGVRYEIHYGLANALRMGRPVS